MKKEIKVRLTYNRMSKEALKNFIINVTKAYNELENKKIT